MRADETHKLAEHTKHPFDEDNAKSAKRDLELAKIDREETEKRKKAEDHAKAEEAKRLEHEAKQHEKGEKK